MGRKRGRALWVDLRMIELATAPPVRTHRQALIELATSNPDHFLAWCAECQVTFLRQQLPWWGEVLARMDPWDRATLIAAARKVGIDAR